MSNGGAVSRAVGDGEKLATVGPFGEEVFDGLEKEPFGERDLAGRGCSLGADAGNDDFIGSACKCGERQGFKFRCGLGAAEEGFYSADFVEVGHARGGVSKWKSRDGVHFLFKRGPSGVLGHK